MSTKFLWIADMGNIFEEKNVCFYIPYYFVLIAYQRGGVITLNIFTSEYYLQVFAKIHLRQLFIIFSNKDIGRRHLWEDIINYSLYKLSDNMCQLWYKIRIQKKPDWLPDPYLVEITS